jgi:hypothetical protein
MMSYVVVRKKVKTGLIIRNIYAIGRYEIIWPLHYLSINCPKHHPLSVVVKEIFTCSWKKGHLLCFHLEMLT